jgi:diguanylate cyclase (GGDEF)-like protein
MNPYKTASADVTLPIDTPRWLLGAVGAALLDGRGEALTVQEASTGRFAHVGSAMLDWLERPAAQVLGRTPAELFDAPCAAALRLAEQSALARETPVVSEHRLEAGAMKREVSVVRVASEADVSGRRWLVSAWRDLTDQRRRERQLRDALEQIEQQQRASDLQRRELVGQTSGDADDGVDGRAQFDDQLRREIDLSMREHREFALVFIEVDPPNEKVRALGAVGAQIIQTTMGRLLRGGTRAMDTACRIDAWRFAVILSGVGLATAHTRMEGLRRRCATEIVVHDEQQLGFSVAMGVASFPHTAQTQQDLIAACEAALSEARRRGGNQVTLAAIRFEAR